ncbi:MAG: hypothetical protein OZSIB_2694 [Candidatus Ozemobacter sibiricus]|uniref:Uncharacterized protein n=1 Tax=Candidatus Ozemobacter sibiricus TaxID=2268124 RepID=A0A367ZRZ1_9BACT|nr:MAG: hypothetical protein OZSIB_2694 [Candidatus Ozemobacter sibiricus]
MATGCGGGGGGGGGGNPTGSTTNPVTVNGIVQLPETNAALTALRAAAADQIDYANLTIEVDGVDGTKTALQGIGSAAFRLTIQTLTRSTLQLSVRNRAGTRLLARQLEGLAQGETRQGVTVDATSTAIVGLIAANASFTARDLEAQVARPEFLTVVQAFLAFLKDQTSGSPLDHTTVQNAIQTAKAAFRPGEAEIKAAYAAMKAALENANLTDEQRLNAFMDNISPDFKDIAGTPSYEDLRTTTASRLDRYTINAYTFTPTGFTYLATDTIKVTTDTYIDVTRKPGKEGGVSGAKIPVSPTPEITWKWSATQNRWLIQQGLPYKPSEINI